MHDKMDTCGDQGVGPVCNFTEIKRVDISLNSANDEKAREKQDTHSSTCNSVDGYHGFLSQRSTNRHPSFDLLRVRRPE
jgi:hypothetical protein